MHIRQRNVHLWALAAALTLAVGCSHGAREPRAPRRTAAESAQAKFVETVQARVSFDLSCPAEQISLQPLGSQAIGARGCGRQLAYTCLCTYHVWTTCTQAICSPDSLSTGH